MFHDERNAVAGRIGRFHLLSQKLGRSLNPATTRRNSAIEDYFGAEGAGNAARSLRPQLPTLMSNPYFEPLQQQQQQHEYHVPAQSFSAPRSPSPGRQRPGPGQGPGQGPGAVHAGSIRRPAHSHHRRSSSGSRGRYAPLENIELA